MVKLLQEKYFRDFGIKLGPFLDITLTEARLTRDAKRRRHEGCSDKRKASAQA
jgi:hypothetical protein